MVYFDQISIYLIELVGASILITTINETTTPTNTSTVTVFDTIRTGSKTFVAHMGWVSVKREVHSNYHSFNLVSF
jgi:hypothetical protein